MFRKDLDNKESFLGRYKNNGGEGHKYCYWIGLFLIVSILHRHTCIINWRTIPWKEFLADSKAFKILVSLFSDQPPQYFIDKLSIFDDLNLADNDRIKSNAIQLCIQVWSYTAPVHIIDSNKSLEKQLIFIPIQKTLVITSEL